jgi:hypothetical protein
MAEEIGDVLVGVALLVLAPGAVLAWVLWDLDRRDRRRRRVLQRQLEQAQRMGVECEEEPYG